MPIPPSRSCSLKGGQKVFDLIQNQASSCCRSYRETLEITDSVADKIKQWTIESAQLDNGTKLPGCEVCWKDEDAGQLSYRQLNAHKKNVNFIELFLSNACNQMCGYCSPKFSSTWENSIAKEGLFSSVSNTSNENLKISAKPKSSSYWFEQLRQYINSCEDHSVELMLLGGEPLMQQKSLEKLLDLTAVKIKQLKITTNLNPPSNKFLLWLLHNIKHVSFNISIDAVPEFNHIPRAGFNQLEFLKNINLLQNNNNKIVFFNTVSALNIFNLPNFSKWAQDINVNVTYNKIHNPSCLSINVVPMHFRKQILNQLDNCVIDESVRYWLSQPEPSNSDLMLFEQYNYLSQYFLRTNTNPIAVKFEPWVSYWIWLSNNYGTNII